MGMLCSAKITKRNRLDISSTSCPQGLEESGGFACCRHLFSSYLYIDTKILSLNWYLRYSIFQACGN